MRYLLVLVVLASALMVLPGQPVLAGAPTRGGPLVAGSFIVVLTFETHADGVLVRQMGQNGYEMRVIRGGAIRLMLQDGQRRFAFEAGERLNNGRPHRVVAAVDRSRQTIRCYADGLMLGEGGPIPADLRVATRARVLIGEAEDGTRLDGSVDDVSVRPGMLAAR